MDALNSDFPSPLGQTSPRGGRDDASSFFNPDHRASRNLDAAGRASTAGYNRGSFFFAGREEPLKGGRDEEEEAGGPDGAWDIYADFNNAGPRYSSAFGGSAASIPAQTNAYVIFFLSKPVRYLTFCQLSAAGTEGRNCFFHRSRRDGHSSCFGS